MNNWKTSLNAFVLQAQTTDLKTSSYIKEWEDFKVRVSFGMGTPAKIPWIGILAPGMSVSNAINPVYLYYKDLETLVLAYGVSETVESSMSWPAEVINCTEKISSFFDQKVARYGDSFVFKAYKVVIENGRVNYFDAESGEIISEIELESDLKTISDYYSKILGNSSESTVASDLNQGLFYMEKQLEDFIIFNWNNTELGKKFDLMIEDGIVISQQYRTTIGPIDILAKDKQTGCHVVIELKRNQTSDETVGQLTRYMGWVKEEMGDKNVKGVIIVGQYDKKLDYARKMVANIEVFTYQVDFKLSEFK